jgi:hypothetical protein
MAGGAGTPNIAALPAIARLGTCESARGPDADRHVKLLSQFAVEGSLSGAYSHSRPPKPSASPSRLRCWPRPTKSSSDAAAFRFWHKCEVPISWGNVRVRGQSGEHMLVLSSSQFDPGRVAGQGSGVTNGARCRFSRVVAHLPQARGPTSPSLSSCSSWSSWSSSRPSWRPTSRSYPARPAG